MKKLWNTDLGTEVSFPPITVTKILSILAKGGVAHKITPPELFQCSSGKDFDKRVRLLAIVMEHGTVDTTWVTAKDPKTEKDETKAILKIISSSLGKIEADPDNAERLLQVISTPDAQRELKLVA